MRRNVLFVSNHCRCPSGRFAAPIFSITIYSNIYIRLKAVHNPQTAHGVFMLNYLQNYMKNIVGPLPDNKREQRFIKYRQGADRVSIYWTGILIHKIVFLQCNNYRTEVALDGHSYDM